MFGEVWFASLEEVDRQFAQSVAAEACRHRGGCCIKVTTRRKPRGRANRWTLPLNWTPFMDYRLRVSWKCRLVPFCARRPGSGLIATLTM